jgi:hypothetical protein
MNSKTKAKRDRTLSDLSDVRRAILDTVSRAPTSFQEQIFLGFWSIKDLLAHLIGWDYTNIEAAQALQAGKLPNFYTYIDKDWRSYNALLVIQYKQEDYSALISNVCASYNQLTNFLQTLPVEDFFRDWGVRYKGIKVTIARLLVAETKDEKIHLEQINAFINKS